MKGFGQKFENENKRIQKNINLTNENIIYKALSLHSQGNTTEA